MARDTVNGTYTNIGPATSDGSGQGSFVDNAAPVGAAFYKVSRSVIDGIDAIL